MLLTDGLLEAPRPDGVLFGTQRVVDLMSTHPDRSARELIQLLRREVDSFAGEKALQDDLTLVVAKVQALPDAPS